MISDRQDKACCHCVTVTNYPLIKGEAGGKQAHLHLTNNDHGRLLERWYPPQNRQCYRILCFPGIKYLHSSISFVHILLWKGDLHYSGALGVPHLVHVSHTEVFYSVLTFLFIKVSHPHSSSRYCHLPVLPRWQKDNYRWHLLEVSAPCHPQCHLRQPLGYSALYHW
jgi:hypothetical protein